MRVSEVKNTSFNQPSANDLYNAWRRQTAMSELDRKKTEQERYRKEIGMGKTELLEQTAKARKIGFNTLLAIELDKKR